VNNARYSVVAVIAKCYSAQRTRGIKDMSNASIADVSNQTLVIATVRKRKTKGGAIMAKINKTLAVEH
jgi:hypothetical protein